MKRFAALFVCMMMLMILPATAEKTIQLPQMPVFTADFGLDAFFASLEEEYGASPWWPLEIKAWLSDHQEALLDLEYQRLAEYHSNWVVNDQFFTQFLRCHRHGLPDENAIPYHKALTMAVEHITAQGYTFPQEVLDAPLFFYLVDDPEHPLWYFCFRDFSVFYNKATVVMDAHTGIFARSTDKELVAAAKAFLPTAEILIANQPKEPDALDEYTYNTYFDSEKKQWCISFFHRDLLHELIFTVEDGTNTVLNFDSCNG